MTRTIFLVFATGCLGVVSVDDPTPTPVPTPPVPEAILIVSPTFVSGDQVGGCELSPQGGLFVELSSTTALQPFQTLYQPCGAEVSYIVQPVSDAVLTVSSADPATTGQDNGMRAELPDAWDLWYASDPIGLGDLLVDTTTAIDATLTCRGFDCPLPSDRAAVTVYPTFHTLDASGGCGLAGDRDLWLELDPMLDAFAPQVWVTPCDEPTTWFIDPTPTPWSFRVSTMNPYGNFDAFEPMPEVFFQSDWGMLDALAAGEVAVLDVDLVCYDWAVDDGCGGG